MNSTELTVAIVPGHGGKDGGGSGGGMRESKINLNVALKLKELLEHEGVKVLISRTTDAQYLTPSQQLAFINKSKANIGISIHHNDSDNEKAVGSEVFYQPSSKISKALAVLIDNEFRKLGQTSRGVKTFTPGSIAVMSAKIPTVLTEYAFLTLADVEDVRTLSQQHAQANAIMNAIMIIKDLV